MEARFQLAIALVLLSILFSAVALLAIRSAF